MIFKLVSDTQIPRIGIIGCGFSGTMVLANIVAKAKGPLHIELFEEGETPAQGIAYGTQEVRHLLNVRAVNMGAFSGKPDDFYNWLQSDAGKEAAHAIAPGLEIAPESYAPRKFYGAYLQHIFNEALTNAKARDIEIHQHHGRVTDAELHNADTQQILLSVMKGGIAKEVLVDALVLATGNLPPRRFSFQPGLIRGVEHYVSDIWHPRAESLFPHNVSQLGADSEIVIIGTGLTTIDTVLTLKQQGYKGTITAISRHGLLPAPHVHSKPYHEWEWTKDPESVPSSALKILQRLRLEVRTAQSEGYDWRSVMDSLRPITQLIWKRLGTREKRKFLRRLFTLWNVHRHRMAPDIHAEIKAMQQSGTLKVLAGKIYYVGSDADGLTIAYRKRGTNRVETIRAGLVLNCTGPEYDIAASSHRLLKNLRDKELVTIGPLRIGIDLTKEGTARGRASESIFPLGTLLVGELLECTAVPELREQAHETAVNVLRRLSSLRDHDRRAQMLMGAWI